MMSYTERCWVGSKGDFTGQEQFLIEKLFAEEGKLDVKKVGNLEYIIEWAKMNGVLFPLTSCLRRGMADISEGDRIKRIYDGQRQMAVDIAELANELITLFEGEGIRLLPIKTFLQFPYVDDDLDVVTVDNDRIADYRKILLRNGYYYLKSRSSLREPKKRFYLPRGGHKSGLRIHLHFAISWNGVDYLDIKRVWERRRSMKIGDYEIPVPSIEDEILIMAAHAVHENRYILLGEMLQLKLLTTGKDVDWSYILESAKKYNWLAGLYLFLAVTDEIMKKIGQDRLIPQWLLIRLAGENKILRFLERSLTSWDVFARDSCFPVIIPFSLTSFTFLNKFFSDLKEKRVRELGREFIAYTLVDWAVFWRFKKDIRRVYELKERP
jgi:hypothetical protein